MRKPPCGFAAAVHVLPWAGPPVAAVYVAVISAAAAAAGLLAVALQRQALLLLLPCEAWRQAALLHLQWTC